MKQDKDFLSKLQKNFETDFDIALSDNSNEPHTFSPEFEEKMRRMLYPDIKEQLRKKRKKRKNLLIAAAICIIVASLLTLTTNAFRDPLTQFFSKLSKDGTDYEYSYVIIDPKQEIEYEYEPKYIPEGFEFVERTESVIRVSRQYETGNGERIVLSQAVQKSSKFSTIVGEVKQKDEISIKNVAVDILQSGHACYAIFVYDGYIMKVSYLHSCSYESAKEEVIKIIESILP